MRILAFGYKLLLRSRTVFTHEYSCGYIEMCILSAHNFANAWFQFVLGKWGSWSLVHLPAGTYTRQWLCQPTCASCYYSFSISHRNEAFLILVGTFLHLLAREMAFIIFCLKLLAYLLLIFLLLLNWVQRKAIRNTSLGTIKYNSSGAINLQIKHMVVSSVLYFSSLYVRVVEVGSSRSSMGLRAAWALVEEGEAGTGLAGAMDLFCCSSSLPGFPSFDCC